MAEEKEKTQEKILQLQKDEADFAKYMLNRIFEMENEKKEPTTHNIIVPGGPRLFKNEKAPEYF